MTKHCSASITVLLFQLQSWELRTFLVRKYVNFFSSQAGAYLVIFSVQVRS